MRSDRLFPTKRCHWNRNLLSRTKHYSCKKKLRRRRSVIQSFRESCQIKTLGGFPTALERVTAARRPWSNLVSHTHTHFLMLSCGKSYTKNSSREFSGTDGETRGRVQNTFMCLILKSTLCWGKHEGCSRRSWLAELGIKHTHTHMLGHRGPAPGESLKYKRWIIADTEFVYEL